MVKALLFFLVLGLVSAYYFTNKLATDSDDVLVDNLDSKELLKDKELHLAFKKILINKENRNRSPSSDTPKFEAEGNDLDDEDYNEEDFEDDEVMNNVSDPEQTYLTSGDYADRFKNEMASDDKKDAIKILSAEISNDYETLNGLKELNEDENAVRIFEERIVQKENQLKYLSTIAE